MKQLSYKDYFWLLIGGIVIYLCQDITSADKIYVPGVFFLLWMVFAPLIIMIMLFRYWLFYLVVSISAFVLFSQFAEGSLVFFAAYAGVMLGIFIKHFFSRSEAGTGFCAMGLELSILLLVIAVFGTVKLTAGDKVFWLLLSLLSISGLPIILSIFVTSQLIIDISMVVGPWLIFICRLVKIDGVDISS